MDPQDGALGSPLEHVLRGLQSTNRALPLSGLTGSAPAYLLSELIHRSPQSYFIYVCPTETTAQDFYKDLLFFLPKDKEVAECVALYPA